MTTPTWPLDYIRTYPLTTGLGSVIGDGYGSSGDVVLPDLEPFPLVVNGVTPVLDIDSENNRFLFNGNTYNNWADFTAATGNATIGSGRVPIAALGSAPWSFRFKGIPPATIAATRNYAFAFYGGTTNLAYVRLDQSTSNSQFTVVSSGTTQAAFTNPVASSLGSQWYCAGTFGTNFGDYSSIARDTGTIDTVLTIPAFNTGIALGYDPANSPNGKWLGTWQRLTVWNSNLGADTIRALSSGNIYGPSRVTLAGFSRSVNTGTTTLVSEVASDGTNVVIEIDNSTREMTGIKRVGSAPNVKDDHNTAAMCLTDDGGISAAWTNHDTGNVIYFAKATGTDLNTFGGSSTLTLGGTLIPAYGTMRKQVSTGYLFFLFRTNQNYWSYAKSTDHGVTWSYVGRFLDDSADSGDKVLVTSSRWVSDGVLRCLVNREPQYLDTTIKILDINVDTLDITAASGSIGTVGVANGALMGSCGTVWNPGSGLSAFVRDFKVWNQGLVGLIDEATNIQSYYWLNCNNTSAPFVSSSWDKVLITTEPVGGKAGGGCVIGVSGLERPQVAISKYSDVDSQYHLQIWEGSNAAGASWSMIKEIAAGGDSGTNMLRAPASADGADAGVPLVWLSGTYTNYDNFAQQLYWQKTPA